MSKEAFAAVALAATLLVSRTASAQVDTYLLVPSIAGESTDLAHKDWIDVESFGQTLEPSKNSVVCAGTAVKSLDAASPGLWAAVAANQVFPQMTLEMFRSGDRERRVLQETLLNVRISRVVLGNDPVSGRQLETLTLVPQSVTLRVTRYDPATGKSVGRRHLDARLPMSSW